MVRVPTVNFYRRTFDVIPWLLAAGLLVVAVDWLAGL
jgi:hypothetical protein